MTARRRGGRARQAGLQRAAGEALAAWRQHTAHCLQCNRAAGHPGSYCDPGFRLCQQVAVTREAARVAQVARGAGQGALW